MRRRIPWQLPVAAALLVLLAVLATLQYRWVGEVTDAERERLRASMRTHATETAREFDAQLTRLFVAFHVNPSAFDTDAAGTIAAAYTNWRSTTTSPAIVRAVYMVERTAGQPPLARRFDPERGTFEAAALPDDVAAELARTANGPIGPDAIAAHVPALFIAVPHVKQTDAGQGRFALITDPASVGVRLIAVALDVDRLRSDVLAPLLAREFGDPDTSEYAVTVVRRDQASAPLVATGGAAIAPADADVAVGLFDLRLDELTRLADRAGLPPLASGKGRVSITIVRRTPDEGVRVAASGDDTGAWQLRVRPRSGSLNDVVARSRWRNLGIGLGVLALLAASVVLIIAAAQRQQRLARQQMEFVAAVSHDLRTPLAVICSAGENLADGVVADTVQVKRYGALIQTEGRRLHDMVERVMTFAGITSGALIRPRRDVDVARVIDDAVASAAADARDRGITVRVHIDAALPAMVADTDALRSAVQNVLDNAIKYSPGGAAVDGSAAPSGGGVRIRVADRGLGIDQADIEQVGKPFFRGRRAIDAQVRGSGIGMSVVRHVMEAHHGDVAIESAVGEGTTVTLTLPPLHLHDKPARLTAGRDEAQV